MYHSMRKLSRRRRAKVDGLMMPVEEEVRGEPHPIGEEPEAAQSDCDPPVDTEKSGSYTHLSRRWRKISATSP